MPVKIPYASITQIPKTNPAATPSLWNSRYTQIDQNFAALSEYVDFSECSSAGSAVSKAVTVNNFVRKSGARVLVRFKNSNTASNPKLNVSGTGAAPIR